MNEWLPWCRLCAAIEISKDALMILRNDLIQIVRQHFTIELCTGDDKFPIAVCADCLKFAIKLESFCKQCIKVDKMFAHLVSGWEDGLNRINLTNIRYEYGVDSNSLVDCDTIQNKNLHNEITASSSAIVHPHNLHKPQANLKVILRPRRKTDIPAMKVSKRIVHHSSKAEVTKTRIKVKPDDQTIPLESITSDISSLETLVPCPICSKLFKNPKARTLHLKKEHSEIRRPYKCTTCCKAFSELYKLKYHEINHVPKIERPVYTCSQCDKIFCRPVTLYMHNKNVHINDRKFICEECGKSFHSNYLLKEHYITHSEDRSVQCSFCSKSFKNHKQLKIHEDTHSGTSYECKICSKVLNTKRNLTLHINIAHSQVKRFKCHLCNSKYKTKQALKRHIGNSHLGLKIR